MIKFREPALASITLITPAVGLVLLFVADLSAAAQAGWNGVAVAVAGLLTAALVVRERLVPAILGFSQAVLALLSVYGWGFTAEQSTALTGFLALVLGIWIRQNVVAVPEREPVAA